MALYLHYSVTVYSAQLANLEFGATFAFVSLQLGILNTFICQLNTVIDKEV